MFLVPPLTITKGETNSRCHKSDWRDQQNQNTPANRALPVFCRACGIAVTHGASLRQGWGGPECNQQGSGRKTQLHRAPTPR